MCELPCGLTLFYIWQRLSSGSASSHGLLLPPVSGCSAGGRSVSGSGVGGEPACDCRRETSLKPESWGSDPLTVPTLLEKPTRADRSRAWLFSLPPPRATLGWTQGGHSDSLSVNERRLVKPLKAVSASSKGGAAGVILRRHIPRILDMGQSPPPDGLGWQMVQACRRHLSPSHPSTQSWSCVIKTQNLISCWSFLADQMFQCYDYNLDFQMWQIHTR